MLSAIVAVTLLVPDVHAAERAYQTVLHYQTVERGRVPRAIAEAWGAPRAARREFVLMQPSSNEPVFIRFVAGRERAPAPLHRLGWNATEILAEDPAALERQLTGTLFDVVGPAAPLEFNPAVVAMQATGPGGEMLYFTHIPPGQSKINLGSATSFVDRVFIVVLGAREIRETLDFYSQVFGLPVTAPTATKIDVLADAYRLPRGTQFPIAIVRLPARFLIEIDQRPAGAEPLRSPPRDLPAGMAMVSFTVPSLEPFRDRLVAAPRIVAGLPYGGRRTGLLLGPSGERIELIETGDAGTASH